MDDIDILQNAAALEDEARLRKLRMLRNREDHLPVPENRECESCGDDIPKARLEARPATTMCVDCQQEREDRR
ncbi:TraR/DksA C4-type zinc finger protein [Thalassospira xiamenensis]|uniref:Phage/conjugal plasmid C-4 type zinc finger protein, TraR family n=1 Tax=Thalassospira xiamenensis TaxID=220697 RepID=A0A285TU09_9PROT|nr:TraR/DksA C4-type zinc finger protein [Thalassospira xiamenensis]SOC27351.1 phage/conjugal plasmid C-4 type zinc finger protein, TraR family [Thalassospira xiamenensis]